MLKWPKVAALLLNVLLLLLALIKLLIYLRILSLLAQDQRNDVNAQDIQSKDGHNFIVAFVSNSSSSKIAEHNIVLPFFKETNQSLLLLFTLAPLVNTIT